MPSRLDADRFCGSRSQPSSTSRVPRLSIHFSQAVTARSVFVQPFLRGRVVGEPAECLLGDRIGQVVADAVDLGDLYADVGGGGVGLYLA